MPYRVKHGNIFGMAAIAQSIVLVMGGSARQAKNYIQAQGLDRRSTRIVYEGSDLQTHGHDADLVLIGDYWNNPAYDQLMEMERSLNVRVA